MNFTKDETAQILQALGYEIDRAYKFKIRDERTASASINPKNGKIKDFGSGWGGSIIDFMVEFHNFTQKEAFAKASNITGRKQDIKFSNNHTSKDYEKPKINFITQEYIDKFAKERKENWTRYWELLSQTLPTANAEQKKAVALRYEIGYSKQADRLIMPIKDENGNCLTFWKYNKNPTPFQNSDGKAVQLPKVMFSKNRARCPFNLQDLKQYAKEPLGDNDTIFIVEGEKDCLNALACGFKAITFGSASTKIDDKYISMFQGLNVSIAYDLDEAGQSGAKNLQQQLKSVCNKIEVIDWKNLAKKLNFADKLKEGFDFTDFLIVTQQEHKTKIRDKDI